MGGEGKGRAEGEGGGERGRGRNGRGEGEHKLARLRAWTICAEEQRKQEVKTHQTP